MTISRRAQFRSGKIIYRLSNASAGGEASALLHSAALILSRVSAFFKSLRVRSAWPPKVTGYLNKIMNNILEKRKKFKVK